MLISTKVSPATAELLNVICDTLKVDTYHVFQWFVQVLVRMASPHHELTPEIQKLMALMEHDSGWQTAFNMCSPSGRLKVAQAILILEQEGKSGFGAVMINKPWMGEARQTECVDDILERVLEVTMHGVYRRIRELGATMDCKNLSDVLLTMLDAQAVLELEQDNARHMQGDADYSDYGRQIAYGKKTKSVHRRTPDGEAAREQRIRFGAEDREQAREEAERGQATGGTDDDMDFRPFDQEW